LADGLVWEACGKVVIGLHGGKNFLDSTLNLLDIRVILEFRATAIFAILNL